MDFSCSGANLQTLTNRQAVRFVFAMAVKKNPSSLIIFFFQAPYSKREAPQYSPFIALLIPVECYLIIDVSLKAGFANISKQLAWEETLLSC